MYLPTSTRDAQTCNKGCRSPSLQLAFLIFDEESKTSGGQVVEERRTIGKKKRVDVFWDIETVTLARGKVEFFLSCVAAFYQAQGF